MASGADANFAFFRSRVCVCVGGVRRNLSPRLPGSDPGDSAGTDQLLLTTTNWECACELDQLTRQHIRNSNLKPLVWALTSEFQHGCHMRGF